MASIVKRTRKDGTPSYHVKYTDGNKKQRWEQFDRAKDANLRKSEIENQLARNRHWAPPASVRFEAYANGWLENNARPALKPRVHENYARAVRLVLNPAVGKKQLGRNYRDRRERDRRVDARRWQG